MILSPELVVVYQSSFHIDAAALSLSSRTLPDLAAVNALERGRRRRSCGEFKCWPPHVSPNASTKPTCANIRSTLIVVDCQHQWLLPEVIHPHLIAIVSKLSSRCSSQHINKHITLYISRSLLKEAHYVICHVAIPSQIDSIYKFKSGVPPYSILLSWSQSCLLQL